MDLVRYIRDKLWYEKTSKATSLNRWIQRFQLHARAGGSEPPVHGFRGSASALPPCAGFTDHGFPIRNSPRKALPGQNIDPGFGHAEPAAALRDVMRLKPDRRARGLPGSEGLAKRGESAGVQAVYDQDDPRMFRESEVKEEDAVEKLDTESCGKPVPCLPPFPLFISVPRPPTAPMFPGPGRRPRSGPAGGAFPASLRRRLSAGPG